ncbi:hypothetical protein [Paraflavitalea speifideaquila]|uniref:hypothetical protein n=1 Tax=Paraflavitalea speifideaquila TaxID=3076558 RepID=UPI0028E654D6|nr:hypothetical protein [Paraflavitalea speifideiaquila]
MQQSVHFNEKLVLLGMSLETAAKSVAVVYENTARCPFRNKPPHFYHMVYIIAGTGQVNLNDAKKVYQPGYMFFLHQTTIPILISVSLLNFC